MITGRFYTSTGWLTPFALSCGYIEEKSYGSTRIRLFRRDGAYHVTAYDHENKVRRFWESFHRLTDARRHYRNAEALLVAGEEAPVIPG